MHMIHMIPRTREKGESEHLKPSSIEAFGGFRAEKNGFPCCRGISISPTTQTYQRHIYRSSRWGDRSEGSATHHAQANYAAFPGRLGAYRAEANLLQLGVDISSLGKVHIKVRLCASHDGKYHLGAVRSHGRR